MDSSSTIPGHSDRIIKTIIVKKPKERAEWTDRTTSLVDKYCEYHKKICKFTENAEKCKERRKLEYKNRKAKNEPKDGINLFCKTCEKYLTPELFYNDPSRICGKADKCKICKKEYDKKRNDTWPVLFRAAYRSSLRSHGNTSQANPISLIECENLLKKQNGRCNHCKVVLECEQGSVIDANYKRASLDRIDTSIVGYGNNSQWLCVSCNKGKCTMPDEMHKAKFNNIMKQLEIEILRYKLDRLENYTLISKTVSC
jgi:hypothetical protein